MKIIIDIPEEFEIDFKNDRFDECFSRLYYAASSSKTNIAGNYELETLEMLRKVFKNAVTDKELFQQMNKAAIYPNIEVNAKFVALDDLKEIVDIRIFGS